jgi:hypothetical protein
MIIVLVVFCGCESQQFDERSMDGLRVVVFQSLLEKHATDRKGYNFVYFLCLKSRTNPSQYVLEQFSNSPFKVRSCSHASAPEVNPVVDRETGAEGTILEISQPERKGLFQTKFEVQAEFHMAMLVAAGFRYVLRHDGAKWVVESMTETWKS